jgi:hypothetical protein
VGWGSGGRAGAGLRGVLYCRLGGGSGCRAGSSGCELLLLLKLDVAGVADMHLGTSWLHEAVWWAWGLGCAGGRV